MQDEKDVRCCVQVRNDSGQGVTQILHILHYVLCTCEYSSKVKYSSAHVLIILVNRIILIPTSGERNLLSISLSIIRMMIATESTKQNGTLACYTCNGIHIYLESTSHIPYRSRQMLYSQLISITPSIIFQPRSA